MSALQKSLKSAFSPSILPGGKAIAKQGSSVNASQAPPASLELQAIEPVTREGASGTPQGSTSGQQSASAAAGGHGSIKRLEKVFNITFCSDEVRQVLNIRRGI